MPFVATSAIAAPEHEQNVNVVNRGTVEDCQGAISRLTKQTHITMDPATHQRRRVDTESTIGAQTISSENASDAVPTIPDTCLTGTPAVANALANAPPTTPTGHAAQ